MSTSRTVNCPTCLKAVTWDTNNPHRPFCSERCRLIDLGDWAAGRHVIAGEPVSVHDEERLGSDPDDY